MYGFHKSARPLEVHAFSHPYFLKGKINLLNKIKRKHPDQQVSDRNECLYFKHYSTQQLIQTVCELETKHSELEKEYKDLYNVSKEYCHKLSTLLSAVSKTREKQQNIETLMLWLLSSSLPKFDSSAALNRILSEIKMNMSEFKFPQDLICNSLNELISAMPSNRKKTMTIRIDIDNNELEISRIARSSTN
jgi:hypothetical protein